MFGTTQYITLKAAKVMLAAAEAEANANNWAVSIAIVDAGTNLIALQRMDGASIGATDVALTKARCAAKFNCPTQGFEQAVASGSTSLLAVEGIIPIEGGIPVVAGDTVVGAIGVSGRTAAEDGQIAMAAIEAVQKAS